MEYKKKYKNIAKIFQLDKQESLELNDISVYYTMTLSK